MKPHPAPSRRAEPDAFAPAVCFGAVMHERHVQAHNRFIYPTAFLRLPLSRLNELQVPLLGIDRFNLFAFHSRDHGRRDGAPLLPWLRDILVHRGLDAVCDGEVVLQTMPRVLGYVFNPVSFWFCHDRGGALRVVLAEVNNTFGEHHNYLVHHSDLRPIRPGDELVAQKLFHVSPFFPVRGEYRFHFDTRGAVHAVAIDLWDGGVRQLGTRLSGRAEVLDGRAMAKWLLRHPLMTLGVIARIHWQALRLALRRVTFHRKPAPPIEETT
ncbi:MAG: DUF1365 domain-containing protein [Proteobacteria bacterium]|nr:DUF1365 domain-containing protein [Pseudomonadota bacterium]MBS0552334.1 DUF1365 domain-containing protein [Pseudomonadota bacterium]